MVMHSSVNSLSTFLHLRLLADLGFYLPICLARPDSASMDTTVVTHELVLSYETIVATILATDLRAWESWRVFAMRAASMTPKIRAFAEFKGTFLHRAVVMINMRSTMLFDSYSPEEVITHKTKALLWAQTMILVGMLREDVSCKDWSHVRM